MSNTSDMRRGFRSSADEGFDRIVAEPNHRCLLEARDSGQIVFLTDIEICLHCDGNIEWMSEHARYLPEHGGVVFICQPCRYYFLNVVGMDEEGQNTFIEDTLNEDYTNKYLE